jgi:hypothetical protein
VPVSPSFIPPPLPPPFFATQVLALQLQRICRIAPSDSQASPAAAPPPLPQAPPQQAAAVLAAAALHAQPAQGGPPPPATAQQAGPHAAAAHAGQAPCAPARQVEDRPPLLLSMGQPAGPQWPWEGAGEQLGPAGGVGPSGDVRGGIQPEARGGEPRREVAEAALRSLGLEATLAHLLSMRAAPTAGAAAGATKQARHGHQAGQRHQAAPPPQQLQGHHAPQSSGRSLWSDLTGDGSEGGGENQAPDEVDGPHGPPRQRRSAGARSPARGAAAGNAHRAGAAAPQGGGGGCSAAAAGRGRSASVGRGALSAGGGGGAALGDVSNVGNGRPAGLRGRPAAAGGGYGAGGDEKTPNSMGGGGPRRASKSPAPGRAGRSKSPASARRSEGGQQRLQALYKEMRRPGGQPAGGAAGGQSRR